MGKQLGGINGPYVGKIGNVVGYQWRGIWVTRAMPEEFHDAKSERQLEQRGRFKAMVGFAGRLKDILRIDYSWGEVRFEVEPLRRSLACSENMLMSKGSYDIDIEPDDIQVADTVTVVWEIA